MGMTAQPAAPDCTAAKTSSNDLHGRTSVEAPRSLRAADSLNAPRSPWKAAMSDMAVSMPMWDGFSNPSGALESPPDGLRTRPTYGQLAPHDARHRFPHRGQPT